MKSEEMSASTPDQKTKLSQKKLSPLQTVVALAVLVALALVIGGVFGLFSSDESTTTEKPTNQNESVALTAVENAMRGQDLTPRITQYEFTPKDKGGILIVEDELINALNDQWLGNYYYKADVEFGSDGNAKVLALTKIDFPGNLKWQQTELGKRRLSEAEDRITKGISH